MIYNTFHLEINSLKLTQGLLLQMNKTDAI